MDKYRCFEDLNRCEPEGSFAILSREGPSGLAVIAPHGGAIEPGTSEIANSIAGAEHAYYTFKGRKRTGDSDLHITSTDFDEPIALKLVKGSDKVVAIHGCSGQDPVVYVGGRDAHLREKIRTGLVAAGFQVRQSPNRNLQGDHPSNICNRGNRNCGVQLEISEGLRQKMFLNLNSRKGREITHEVFNRFVSAIRTAILPVAPDPLALEKSTAPFPQMVKVSWLRSWFDPAPPVETEHLVLRSFEDRDLKDLERILSHQTEAKSFPPGLPQTRKKIAALHARWRTQVFSHWAVVLKEHDYLIGFAGVRKLRGNYETEFFYHIEPRCWSEDLAVEAVRGCLAEYFCSSSSLPQLAAVIIPTDLSARRVLVKAGMQFVKMTKSHGIHMLYYEISKQNFQSAKNK